MQPLQETKTPKVVNVVESLSTSSKPVSVAKFDAIVETKFTERFNVENFPTLNLFMIEEAIDFDSRCKAKEIVSSVTKCVRQVSALILG